MNIYAHIMGMGIPWFKKITAMAVYIYKVDKRMSLLLALQKTDNFSYQRISLKFPPLPTAFDIKFDL